MLHMISVEEARAQVTAVHPLLSVRLPLQHAAGLILAEDLIAPKNIPAYPQSSMDGYAIAFDDANGVLQLEGVMPAGSNVAFQLEKGHAVRIFTGAAVPAGANTVVMQEKAMVEDGKLMLQCANLKYGDNVRPVGSEIQEGSLALAKGALLTPAAIGFLAGIGIAAVKVFPRPRVSIIVTGNELQHPGESLPYGQVYEANSFTLLAALQQLHITAVPVHRSPDDLPTLQRLLSLALQQSDVVLMTGGVSVGDFDFTGKAFEACQVSKVFHKVKQKPGKPLLFGTQQQKLVFGLPGNPASVLTCFYQYVLPALEQIMQAPPLVKKLFVALQQEYKKPIGLTHFLKAHFNGTGVQLLTGQESYKLSSFAAANCLAIVPEETVSMAAGDQIEIHILP